MNTQIEKATQNDIEALKKLNCDLFLHDLPSDKYLDKNWPMSQEGDNYFNKAVSSENYCSLVAKENNEIVGYLIGYIWNKWESRPVKTAEIDNMLVIENHRGKGIGKMLISEFKEWCKNKGAKNLVVMAYVKNEDAIDFYKRNGFEDLSVRLHQDLE